MKSSKRLLSKEYDKAIESLKAINIIDPSPLILSMIDLLIQWKSLERGN